MKNCFKIIFNSNWSKRRFLEGMRSDYLNSDKLIIINQSRNLDFKLDFYNPDSTKAFCGNGSLCVLHYLKHKKVIGNASLFSSLKKKYTAKLNSKISLKMNDIDSYSCIGNDYFIDSGAPHHIRFVDDANSFDLEKEVKLKRRSDCFKKKTIQCEFSFFYWQQFNLC